MDRLSAATLPLVELTAEHGQNSAGAWRTKVQVTLTYSPQVSQAFDEANQQRSGSSNMLALPHTIDYPHQQRQVQGEILIEADAFLETVMRQAHQAIQRMHHEVIGDPAPLAATVTGMTKETLP